MIKALSDSELETYARQVVLADIGYDGQLKLKGAKACIVGVGGLGAPTALKLAGMGIGSLRMVDRDIVSRSDLHRQYLYDVDSLGRPKVEVAFEKLNRLNPDVALDPVPESLNSLNSEELIAGMDVVIDGLDRLEPRYLVNRACNKHKVPYIFGAAIEASGNVSTLLPGQTFCLECFMSGLKNEDLPTCGLVGVHPSVLGIVSSVQVSEAVNVLTGKKAMLANKLLYVDLRHFEFNILDISASKTCRVCGDRPAGPPEKVVDPFFEETCARDGRRNFILSPEKRIKIDPGQLEEVLRAKGFPIRNSGRFGITFELAPDISACILTSAIMNAQAPPEVEKGLKAQIIQSYRSILVDGLGFDDSIAGGF